MPILMSTKVFDISKFSYNRHTPRGARLLNWFCQSFKIIICVVPLGGTSQLHESDETRAGVGKLFARRAALEKSLKLRAALLEKAK